MGRDLGILRTHSPVKTQKHEFGNSPSYITTEWTTGLPDSDCSIQKPSCTFSFEDLCLASLLGHEVPVSRVKQVFSNSALVIIKQRFKSYYLAFFSAIINCSQAQRTKHNLTEPSTIGPIHSH